MRCTNLLLVSTFATAALASPAHAQGPRHGAVAAAAPAPAPAEPAGERFTIEELLEAAVQRSPGLTIARADHEEARDRDSAADAVDQWHLVGRVNGQQTTLDRTLASPAVALDTRAANAELGVGRSLSTGAEIAITASTGQVRYVYPTTIARSQAVNDVIVSGTTASARLEASQPLLRGAGADVARADQTTARLASRALSAQAKDEAAGLVRDLVIAYWELAYATEALAVDRDGEALAVRHVAITQDVVRVGAQPPSAVKIAELQLALRKEAILRDQVTVGDQSLAVRRLAGLDLASAALVPSQAPEAPRTEWSEDAAVAATLVHGPSLAQKKLVQRQADVAVDVANNAALPRLDLKLTGEIDGVGSSTGAAFGQLGSAQAYSIMGGLSFQWEIGGAARAAADAARVHRKRLDAERTDLEHQLATAAMSAVRQLRVARQRIDLSEVAIQVADEALRSETVAFQAGRTTIVLVFQRQDDVAQAKLRLARARVDAVEASVLLDYLTGGLLARYGVKVADGRGAS